MKSYVPLAIGILGGVLLNGCIEPYEYHWLGDIPIDTMDTYNYPDSETLDSELEAQDSETLDDMLLPGTDFFITGEGVIGDKLEVRLGSVYDQDLSGHNVLFNSSDLGLPDNSKGSYDENENEWWQMSNAQFQPGWYDVEAIVENPDGVKYLVQSEVAYLCSGVDDMVKGANSWLDIKGDAKVGNVSLDGNIADLLGDVEGLEENDSKKVTQYLAGCGGKDILEVKIVEGKGLLFRINAENYKNASDEVWEFIEMEDPMKLLEVL